MAIDYSKSKYRDTKFGGTEGIVLPSGNSTTDRPAQPVPGQMRYNEDTQLVEQYAGSGANAGWKGIDAPPTLTNVSGVIREDTDVTITVTGSNFGPGSIVYIEGPAVNGIPRALTTTFVNSAELTANTNAASVGYVGGASYDVKVTNTSGLSATLSPAGNIDRDVVWATSAGSLGTVFDEEYGAETYTYVEGATEYQVVKFLAPQDHTWVSPVTGNIDVLLVAGGGGAGSNNGGGGGAGGLIYQSGVSVTAGTSYNITVGAGAPAKNSSGGSGLQGENSTAFGYTAIGGGGGTGGNQTLGTSGGSGGGDGRNRNGGGHAGTAGQGNAGGTSSGADGGGGGGAGQAGNPNGQGSGGNGLQYDIDGTNKYYAGGGVAGCESGSNNGRTAGLGGGGIGGDRAGISGRREGHTGRNGLGGGGGGDTNSDMMSGGGGHGAVIIRYPVSLGKPTRFSLSASDPDGSATTYSVVSGSLPTGMELDSSTGEIKGYTPKVSGSTNSPFTVRATSNNISVDRTFNITVDPIPSEFLVCAMSDTGGGTVHNPTEVTWDNMSTAATGRTHVNWTTFPYWDNWTRVRFTSTNHPYRMWRFERNDTIESIVKTFMSPFSQWSSYGITTNSTYKVFPGPGSSILVGGGDQGIGGLNFQHNNNGSEAYDIPTLGRDGTVWSNGMFWGQIDAPSNYGGFMNLLSPTSGSGGGNTGDKLLVYLETEPEIHASNYTNYLTPTGPLGDARNLSWSRNGTGGFGGTPGNVADAISRDTTTDWPTYGHQQTGANPMWIQVDLGQAVEFDFTFAIGYPGGSHYSRNNFIDASNDGSNWTRIAEWTLHNGSQERYNHGMLLWQNGENVYDNVIDNAYKWIPLRKGTAYRYYRLGGTDFSVTNNYQLVMNWGLLKRN